MLECERSGVPPDTVAIVALTYIIFQNTLVGKVSDAVGEKTALVLPIVALFDYA